MLVAVDVSDPEAEQREQEVMLWMEEFAEWREWWAKWGNRREPGWFTASRERKSKPAPPEWLEEECLYVIDDRGTLGQACGLLSEWKDDYTTTALRRARAAALKQKEDTDTTVWWEHFHLDLMWPAMQWQASAYGVAGMHVATTVTGRLQVFVAPGAMFLNLPSRNGGRVWKVATNYGIGFRLFEFNFPGGRRAVLHINLAKAWLLSDDVDLVTGRSMDFAGFSIAFKKTQ
jgi:hypothetical protein